MNKRAVLKLAAVVLLLVFPIINFCTFPHGEARDEVPQTDISALVELSREKVGEIEKVIEKKDEKKLALQRQKEWERQRRQNEQNLLQQIEQGKTSYRKLFSSVLIVGDSLMNGLQTYQFLDPSDMITKISANLGHLSDHLQLIVDNDPKILLLHYGLNMLEDDDIHRDTFLSSYRELIERLQSKLKDTRIVVSSIFPVSVQAVAQRPTLGRTGNYNRELKKMCEELNIEYLDNESLLPGDGSYYDEDGIHVLRSFYEEKWLPHTVMELGL